MSDTENPLDDLEVYVEGAPLEALHDWLLEQLPNSPPAKHSKKGFRLVGLYQQQPTPITVVKNAGNTGYTSVWVQTRNAPWHDDVALAKAIYGALGATTRCNASPWQQGDDPDEWLEISAQGERTIQWRTED